MTARLALSVFAALATLASQTTAHASDRLPQAVEQRAMATHQKLAVTPTPLRVQEVSPARHFREVDSARRMANKGFRIGNNQWGFARSVRVQGGDDSKRTVTWALAAGRFHRTSEEKSVRQREVSDGHGGKIVVRHHEDSQAVESWGSKPRAFLNKRADVEWSDKAGNWALRSRTLSDRHYGGVHTTTAHASESARGKKTVSAGASLSTGPTHETSLATESSKPLTP